MLFTEWVQHFCNGSKQSGCVSDSPGALNSLWLGISTFPLSSDLHVFCLCLTHTRTHTHISMNAPLCLPVWDEVSAHRSRSGTEAINGSDDGCEWTNQSMVKTQQGSVINPGHQEEPRNTHLSQRSSVCVFTHIICHAHIPLWQLQINTKRCSFKNHE